MATPRGYFYLLCVYLYIYIIYNHLFVLFHGHAFTHTIIHILTRNVYSNFFLSHVATAIRIEKQYPIRSMLRETLPSAANKEYRKIVIHYYTKFIVYITSIVIYSDI